MTNEYFLLPSDIKVINNNSSHKKQIKLKYNSELHFNFIKLCAFDSNNNIKLLEVIDLSDTKLLKQMLSKYNNLQNRVSKIDQTIKETPCLFKGNKPKIMGILNITKDSFYDGGKFFSTTKAIDQAYKLIEEGADIIDIGGESTRPGAIAIPQKDELNRITPVVKELCKNNITVSCDTRNSLTMEKVLDEGVKIINDVSGLNYDKNTLNVIKKYNCYYVLMHSIKNPTTMQKNPKYQNVILEIYNFFLNKINIMKKLEINTSKIILDPGIGFGKNDSHNFQILKYFSIFLDLGLPILIGLSRKSFIGRFIQNDKEDRLACSISLAVDAFLKGASFIRVHDVKATKEAINIFKKANC